MEKITLNEFWNMSKKCAIHCKTKEEAIKLLTAFDKMGKRWANDESYLRNDHWDEYKEDTCYSNEHTYGYKSLYSDNGTKVYDFEEVELMNDNVKKVFDMLGIEPNQEFKIKDSGDDYWHHRYFFDEDLTLKFLDNSSKEWLFASSDTFMGLVKGTYTIVKFPKKKKLRDITIEEYTTWKTKNCSKCKNCIFKNVNCSEYSAGCWINNKDLYSDKFLDQEVEVPEE